MTLATEPTTRNFTLRPFDMADIPTIVALHQEVEQREPSGDYVTATEYDEWLNSPFGKDAVITLAHATSPDGSAGVLVGELVVEKDPRQDHAWGDMVIHPDWRDTGLAETFYQMMERDARARGANELRLGPSQQHTWLIDFLKQRGYQPERYFWEMRLPAEMTVEQPQLPAGFTVRTFVRGQDEPAFMQARNGSFAEHYASIERNLDEIIAITNMATFDPASLFLAFADNGDVAGLCWTAINPDENAARGEQVGWVHTLGVVPAYQRHGLGRALLLIGVQHLRQFVPIVELGVEGLNEKALPLYEGVGFFRYQGRVNMIRPLADEGKNLSGGGDL